MPQMAPLWWGTLFAMFIISMIIMTKMSFFLVSYKGGFSDGKGMGMMTVCNWKW
uniref:ATP synthase F0 subunit 8 n=1 Tax=Ilyocoris cimicoides TaxID=280203 RepID=C5HIR6_9HEMI|nr:ATP synthase F0 subunit 8 [Ilyocoris cimicoides]ACJ69511.1 ATP synthase F0 subunit 8 [Ilyocoris cimicoides]